MFLFIRVLIRIIRGIIFIIIKEKLSLFPKISEKFYKKQPFFEILGPRFTLIFKPFLRENADKHEV